MLRSIIRRYNSLTSAHQYLVKIISLFVIVITVIVLFAPRSKPAKYTIYSTRRVYHADTFRIYGHGVIFDDVDGKSIILQGEIDIISNKTK
jgi:hypothetical protein